jgi:hypothetical protein
MIVALQQVAANDEMRVTFWTENVALLVVQRMFKK